MKTGSQIKREMKPIYQAILDEEDNPYRELPADAHQQISGSEGIMPKTAKNWFNTLFTKRMNPERLMIGQEYMNRGGLD